MSGPFGSSQFMYATGALAEGSSLRFEDGDSAYLSRTPASAGNRTTWTWSGWVKRGNFGGTMTFLAGSDGALSGDAFYFSNDAINYFQSGVGVRRSSTAVYRDPSAWYHIVGVSDSSNATAQNRFRIYVNGIEVTTWATNATITQNRSGFINANTLQSLGANVSGIQYFDGYLANVAFIDGQALTPTSFGEYEDTLWKPKSDAAIQALTFGTNGFYLPFKQTTEAEGFSTVTYTGNGGTQGIEGVGFEPDFVWIKQRSAATSHGLFDSVRGAGKNLISNTTSSELTQTDSLTSFDSNGFSLGDNTETGSNVNYTNGGKYVAWCWDAGTGSAVSNTDGSITSSVKANTTNGFSIVSYTGTGANATVGHGLSSAPDVVIVKNRDATTNWNSFWSPVGATKWMTLNGTNAAQTASTLWNDTAPTSSVFSLGTSTSVNTTNNYIAYCFHSVSGYSDIGSYTGNGSASGPTVTTGFPVAFVMIKRTDGVGGWYLQDNTRTPTNPANKFLDASDSDAEATGVAVDLTSTGFQLANPDVGTNASGGTYIYMAFADTRDATFFGDISGNSNNWTPNALNNTDVVPDSPVTNFATHASNSPTSAVLSEGNLKVYYSATNWYSAKATMGVSSGKWYWEVNAFGGVYHMIGIGTYNYLTGNNYAGVLATDYGYFNNGLLYNNGGSSAYGATFTTGAIIGVALDMDAGTLTFYKDGVSQGTAVSGLTGTYLPVNAVYGGSTIIANFGQDSSFAGNKTPQGNTDDNGQGDFYYAPPSGFLALTRNNLPTPTITAPDEYFNTVLYSGNNDTGSQAITGIGFQPDWLWLKGRNAVTNHILVDSVRGTGTGMMGALFSNLTDAEETTTSSVHSTYGIVSSLDSDGFTVDAGATNSGGTNLTGRTYAAWNWLAGGTAVSNTDGSITSQVSANQDAGFSVVSHTGNGSNATIGHGLGVAPSMIIHKRRDSTADWNVYHASLGKDTNIILNTTAASYASTTWNNTAPTSSVYSIVAGANTNTATYIAYCFAEVEGYSKIGSYTGNGSSDGTYVHCGFRPAWIMLKRTDVGPSNWTIIDNKRDDVNVSDAVIYPHLSNAEGTQSATDMLSNGFKLRHSTSEQNGLNATYIFIAFAEAPFRNANAR